MFKKETLTEKGNVCQFCKCVNPIEDGNFCKSCGSKFGELEDFITDRNPKAKPTTHVQSAWACSTCKRAGVVWIRKDERLRECPNCKRTNEFSTRRMESVGQIRSIWKM